MSQFARQLRTPEERVGMLSNASLPPPPDSTNADETLFRRALQQRDEAAFARVLDQYYPVMLRLALTHVRTRAAADEAIQDTWLAALQGFPRFEGRSSIRTWVFRILRNIAKATGRREGRSSSFSDLAAADGAHGADDSAPDAVDGGSAQGALWTRGTDPEQELLSAELAERIEAAIATLPPKQREVLQLRDVEGWSAGEVCNALGLSDTNQRVILHRARDRVRAELRGYLHDNGGCQDDRDDGMF